MKNKAEFYAKLAHMMVEHELKMIYPNDDEAVEVESTDGSFIELGPVLTPDSLRAMIEDIDYDEEPEKDSKSTNLLPCPFCGSVDILTDAYCDESSARCANCGATGPQGDYPTCQKLWNERAYSGRYPDAHPDLVIRTPPISKEDEDALRSMGKDSGDWVNSSVMISGVNVTGINVVGIGVNIEGDMEVIKDHSEKICYILNDLASRGVRVDSVNVGLSHVVFGLIRDGKDYYVCRALKERNQGMIENVFNAWRHMS